MSKGLNPEGEFVTYYGKDNEWRLYRRSDGFIVGYRSKRNDTDDPVSIERVVTCTKDPDRFCDFVERRREQRRKYYNPYKDPNQTRIE